jgi:putative ABC transport system permease protein
MGLPEESRLWRLVDREGTVTRLPSEGLVISRKLADILHVKAGDTIRVEVLQEKRPVVDVPIVALLDDISGLNSFMNIDALNRLMGDGPRAGGAMLTTDPLFRPAIYRHLKETPSVASVTVKQASVDSFKNTVARNMNQMRIINLSFAIIIALGVVYNGARISLSERSRELATLRVIGFTKREISTILLGEIGTITLLGIPFGLFLGYWMAWGLAYFLDQEVFRFPFVIAPATYGLAAGIVLAASIGSGLSAAEARSPGPDRRPQVQRIMV